MFHEPWQLRKLLCALFSSDDEHGGGMHPFDVSIILHQHQRAAASHTDADRVASLATYLMTAARLKWMKSLCAAAVSPLSHSNAILRYSAEFVISEI